MSRKSTVDPIALYEQLVDQALAQGYVNYDKIRYYQRTGRPMPEHMKPGAMLERLSPEQREALASLTSADVLKRRIRPDLLPIW